MNLTLSKRQQQKIDTRNKILEAAANLFAQFGFSVTTTQIAKEAGISHGSIFTHFPTKENLVDYVIDDFFRKLNSNIHKAVTINSGLKELLHTHLNIIAENEGFYSRLITQISELPGNTKAKLFAHQSTLSFHFGQAITNEIEQGKVIDVPLYMMFNMWLAILHYYLQNSEMFAKGEGVIKKHKNELVESYLKMIR